MDKDLAVFKACSDATRLRILFLLTERELCVCEIMAVLDLPQGKVSRHLAVLKTVRSAHGPPRRSLDLLRIGQRFLHRPEVRGGLSGLGPSGSPAGTCGPRPVAGSGQPGQDLRASSIHGRDADRRPRRSVRTRPTRIFEGGAVNPASDDTGFYPGLNRYFKARLTEFDLIPADRGKAAGTHFSVRRGAGGKSATGPAHLHLHPQFAPEPDGPDLDADRGGILRRAGGVPPSRVGRRPPPSTPGPCRPWSGQVSGSTAARPEDNPVYTVFAGNGLAPVRAFSKAFLDPFNPRNGFCAVLTCASADRDCPVITSADERVSPSLRGSETARRNGSGAGPVRYDLPRDLPGDGLGVRPRGPGGRGGPGGRSVIPPRVPALRIPAPSRRAFPGNNG